ncbi:MAG: monovalent cation:proton antiporter-2 (CPA2) family protein [Methylophilaceae bacterium]|uniref:monovalent cation:proton antiporter-2 (CPA2) family protein n=1 Tax=Methylovorus sp. MM2 TaxID=1848038 RepID=UPI0007E12A05|nr:monovalent cation:proton antiporter-2 (CPA2) family protein [Methylovorus sp. MM2]OAM52240.1 glutathione-regulated potassium-efflux system protein KefC [Methylovorus sp. MM2]
MAAAHHIPDLLLQSAIYLGVAVMAVPISKRIGLGSVLGYLLAGILIGPWGLGLIDQSETVLHFAEFGVVMMLFLIGLELELEKLLELRIPVFGMGGLQVILTAVAVFALGLAFKLDWRLSLVVGMGVAMSSTAIAMQTLSEQGVLQHPAGRSAFSVLLFQDLAVIPIMVLLLILAPGTGTGEGLHIDILAIVKAVGLVVLLILGGNYLLRPVLRYIANTGLREIFIAFALFLIIGVSILMTLVGLSMALGAFIAGLLLADSEYRQELELDIEPFKGLLLGLFFIAVGMSVNLELILQKPLFVLGLGVGFVLLKTGLLFSLAKIFRQRTADALLFSLTLSQVGEFAFVIFNSAADNNIFTTETASLLNSVVAISMLTTPLLMLGYNAFNSRRMNRKDERHDEFEVQRPVIIAGFGRFGQVITRLLNGIGMPPTVIELDPNQIELVRNFGFKAYYGDITRPDVLQAAGIENARLFVLAIDNPEDALATARYVQKHYPHVKILARARNRTFAADYVGMDIECVRETFLSSLHLGEKILRELGYSAFQAYRTTWRFRQHDENMMRETHAMMGDMQQLVTHSHRSRETLANILAKELGTESQPGDLSTGWDKKFDQD